MSRSFTENDLKQLEVEFKLLNTIEEKFDFWLEKLEMPYYYCRFTIKGFTEPFIINAKSKAEQIKINQMMIEEYKKYSNDYFANPEIILDFNKLKNEFLKKFDKVVNKKEYLHQEIFNIEKNISEKIGCIKNQYSDYSIYYDSGFNNYYFNSIEPTLDIQIHIEEIISLLNGFQLAKYKKFLNEQQINLQNNLQKPTKNDKFSHLQQLWILKSFINNNKSLTNTKLSEFYSQILNKDKETTRQKLSEINSGITIKKLKEIHDFFIKFEFHEQAQYINNQIEKKSNRKK